MEWIDGLVERVVELPLVAAWVVIVLATFVSEDLTCIAAGLAAASGRISPWHSIAAAGLGIWLGDLGLYLAGRCFGRAALARAPLKWVLDADDLARGEGWFRARGAAVILISRFVPGTRLPVYVASGTLGLGFVRFSLLTALAVAVWAPLIGGGAMLLGREVLPWIEQYQRWGLAAAGALVLAWLAVIRIVVPSFTWRGRRRLVGRWKRLVQWEFWPAWMTYAPVVPYIVFLALRHRSLTLFTAVNPGIPAGGFVGESKDEILRRLEGAGEAIVRSRSLPAALDLEARMRLVEEFLEVTGTQWPIVLKPDAGQRGSGVLYARELGEVRDYLARIDVDCLVQECARGEEFGVFYCRRPSEERGRVVSITRKVFPVVVGDGTSTLEELVLRDPRAVCMERLYLRVNAARAQVVLREGERVQLVEIGNHCKGTIFLDGNELATPELECEIDRLSKCFDGFFFGRYDLRVPSVEHLRRGEGLKVIELNGATSEATHIYDPRHGPLYGWATLCRQWRLLYEIAAENRARGAAVVTAAELLRAWREYRRGQRSHPG